MTDSKNVMLTYCLKGGKFQTEYFATEEEARQRAERLARGSQGFSVDPRVQSTTKNPLEKLVRSSFNQQTS